MERQGAGTRITPNVKRPGGVQGPPPDGGRSDLVDVRRLQALRALRDFEFDSLAFLE